MSADNDFPKNRGRSHGNREEKREERRSTRAANTTIDTTDLDGGVLLEAINAALRASGAVRIGATRDGGAWAIGIYGDGEPFTEYIGADEDINTYFGNLAKYYDKLSGS